MRKALLNLALSCFTAIMASPAAHAQTAAADPDAGEARVIVKYRADSSLLRKDLATVAAQQASQAEALGRRIGVAMRSGASVAERTQVVLASGMTSAALAQRLSAETDIEYAVPDGIRRHTSAPNDPLYLAGPPVLAASGGPEVGQWYLRASAGEVQAAINVEPAWDLAAGGASIVVAVIDTGVRFDHPDLLTANLGGNLLPGYDMIADAIVAGDGDGRDDDASDTGDFVTQAELSRSGPLLSCAPAPEDSSWHGTQTSALIGALTNNGIGMAGVGRNVRIVPVRVLGKCGGRDSDILAGMLWAAGLAVPGVPPNPNPAQVLNMSLGGSSACSSAYVDAVNRITAAGAVVVVAAGNGGGHALGTPANCPGVIAVAGLRHVGTKVGFSDLGSQISIAAPGGNCVNTAAGAPCLYPILTAANIGRTAPVDGAEGATYTDSFRSSLGTSFSAPLVSGTVALMLSVQPTLTPSEVRTQLRASARPFPTTDGSANPSLVSRCTTPAPLGSPQFDQGECYCTTTTCGAGMLDAGAAVLAVLGGAAPPLAPTGRRTATEFYHPQFDHYFITADPAETASLAAGGLPPWVATGKTFTVWDAPDTNITNVCRFFSAKFAPRSSHFYSNTALECPGLQAFGVWTLEDLNAFYMMPSPSGTCPAATVPLYRLYNNGQGGAPNHRYTIDLAARASMIAAGWAPEGNGSAGVFACVPE